MKMIDVILPVLYTISAICAVYIIFSHCKYFYERFQKGVVSVFMLAMLFLMIAYALKMLLLLLVRLASSLQIYSSLLMNWFLFSWIIAQFGMTCSLIVLALITHSGVYDQFIYIKKDRGKGPSHADPNANQK
ncbi:hypothetical protein D3C76_111510 [compost metagenome]